jgi:hypothetical protein
MLIKIEKIKSHIILGLIAIGIFLPSSINGNTLSILYPILNAIIAIIIIALSIKQFNLVRSLLVLFIMILLIINTIFTNFLQYQFGTLLVIIPLMFYFSIDTQQINIEPFKKYLNLISILLLILGLGVIFNIEIINDFLRNHYITTFTDLYKYMLSANRPVGPFGSHSIASFIYFLFFILYYVMWLKSKSFLYLTIAIAFALLILALKSFSALFFIIFIIATVINSKFLLKKINIQFFIINSLILIITFLLLNSFIDILTLLSGTDTNGLLSRYGSNGILNNNINYLENNLLMGDGIGYLKNLVYTDSGYIHNLLIYGISGTIVFYFLFYLKIMEKNLIYIFIIIIAFLFFEIGYDIFFYTRTIYLLLLISYFTRQEELCKN